MVRLCTQSEATVLLTGETGTGKDLIAKTIHSLSHRRDKPFVKVSCAAIPSQLIERELFGHEKGAFTGADQDKQGKFDAAEGGTLYLDDVDDIALEQQVKLLHVIEEKEFERVGAISSVKVDVRIIAATKKNLLLEVEKSRFRSDLYYRLNVLRINLPPLRDRIDDLGELVHHHLHRITQGNPFLLDRGLMELLRSHHWPGNVRELAHTLERAYLVGNRDSFSELIASDLAAMPNSSPSERENFQVAIEQTEQDLLQQALLKANGNKSEAARSLGMKLSTFRDKLKRHRLL
jgi:transcriptional regulator with GAF, ATPase, and Fis domain